MINRQILVSLVVIGVIGLVAGGGTFAYFSDLESAENNTLEAGTIDISVDEANPWNATYEFLDMKPCERTEYINVTIRNVGTNPAKIFKMVEVIDWNTGLERFSDPETEEMYSSEPEWEAEMNGRVDDIHNVTDYSLEVLIFANESDFDAGEASDSWLVYEQKDGTLVSDVAGTHMYFGDLEPGEVMMINQDYHIIAEAGNEYQGDSFSFDVLFTALQLNDDSTITEFDDLTAEAQLNDVE